MDGLARILRAQAAVAVRIVSRATTNGIVVSVLGTLDETAAELVRAESGRVPAASLVLDVGGLVSFDDAGLAVLRELAAAGARIEGASPFVQLRLLGEAADAWPASKAPAEERARGARGE